MNIIGLHNRISSGLAILKNKVVIENKTNDYGINLTLETTYIKIINVIFNYDITNSNLLKKNYPGIDGIDKDNRVALQVSATFKTDKIEHTIDQIIKNELYKDFDRLIFIFLIEKTKPSKNFIEKMKLKIGDKFNIDFETDLIEPDDIYNIIFNSQDINKSIEIKRILDDVLEYLPTDKSSGFDFVGVSFDEEEHLNAIVLIDSLLKFGFNVVIKSKKAYDFFKTKKHKFFDYLILCNTRDNLEYIDKYFVIISNKFIKKNIDVENEKIECFILKSCLKKDLKPQIVTFTKFLDYINNKSFRNPKSVSIDNTKKIDEIINNLFYELPSYKYTFEEIEELLLKLYPTYKLNSLTSPNSFRLYNLKMSENDNELNYLIFSHEFKRSEVIGEFEKLYKNEYKKNLNVLLPKDYNQSTELRIKYIKDRFNYAKVISYVDEFLFDKSLKQIPQSELLLNENFIEPLFKIEQGFEKINDIIDWIKNDPYTQVSFIKGAGGIGKTTVSEKIHDEIIKNIDNNIVIFINASSYIDEIKRRQKINESNFDLYTIFELCHDKANTININVFRSNFILGNITLIIDGIDEIISTLTNFNLKNFVNDFSILKEQIGRGKLIINSRDIYINELEKNDPEFSTKHKVFELLKFDRENVIKYFEKIFPAFNNKTNKKVGECISVLDEFYDNIEDQKYIYSPFVLEIIVLIVENDFEYDNIEFEFSSKVLTLNYSNDYLIYKICQREIAKKGLNGFIPAIDNFIKFLSLIAIEKNGVINDDEFIAFLKRVDINLNSENVKSSIKDNPFFVIDRNNKYNFRFDFYNSFFKLCAVYSKLFIPKSFYLSNSFLEVLTSDFKHNSFIFKSLKNKISANNIPFDIILEKIKNLIDSIKLFNKNETDFGFIYLKKCSISNLLLFILSLSENKMNYIDILKFIFQDKNQNNDYIVINELSLIDIPFGNGFVFDFSDIYFTNCYIENYPDLINSKFSDDTYFSESCYISNVNPTKINIEKITADKKNFDDKIIINDNSLFKLLKLKEEGIKASITSIKLYFKSFYSSNNNRINLETTFSNLTDGKTYCISVEEITEILYKNGIVSNYLDKKIILNKVYASKIDKYITQNLPFKELNKSLKEIELNRIS